MNSVLSCIIFCFCIFEMIRSFQLYIMGQKHNSFGLLKKELILQGRVIEPILYSHKKDPNCIFSIINCDICAIEILIFEQ